MKAERIEVQAIHPTGYGCLLENSGLRYYWEEQDWLGFGLTAVAAMEEMLQIVGRKTM